MKKDCIGEIVIGLVESFQRETEEKNEESLERMRERFLENESLYDAEMALAVLNFYMLAAKPFVEKHHITDVKRRNVVESIYSGELPHFVRRVIEQKEGTPCSGDKEHFIIKKLKEYAVTGENQSLYEEYEKGDKYEGRRAFWSPLSFKDTDEVIDAFYRWYNVEELPEQTRGMYENPEEDEPGEER